MRNEMIAIRVHSVMKRRLEEMARADKRTLSDYTRVLLEEHVREKSATLKKYNTPVTGRWRR